MNHRLQMFPHRAYHASQGDVSRLDDWGRSPSLAWRLSRLIERTLGLAPPLTRKTHRLPGKGAVRIRSWRRFTTRRSSRCMPLPRKVVRRDHLLHDRPQLPAGQGEAVGHRGVGVRALQPRRESPQGEGLGPMCSRLQSGLLTPPVRIPRLPRPSRRRGASRSGRRPEGRILFRAFGPGIRFEPAS